MYLGYDTGINSYHLQNITKIIISFYYGKSVVISVAALLRHPINIRNRRSDKHTKLRTTTYTDLYGSGNK